MGATYSARQAARLCDTSEATVRRAIASGRINPTQVDGVWRLTDDDIEILQRSRRTADAGRDARRRTPDAAATSQGDAPASPTQPDADHWRRLVEQLHRENVELSGRIGWLQAELEQARTTIKLLSAPAEQPFENPETSGFVTKQAFENASRDAFNDHPPTEATNHPAASQNGQDSGVQTTSDGPTRPWWAFWRGWGQQPA